MDVGCRVLDTLIQTIMQEVNIINRKKLINILLILLCRHFITKAIKLKNGDLKYGVLVISMLSRFCTLKAFYSLMA